MAQLHQSVATLRIQGDSLKPDEISSILGCTPTESYVKGQIKPSKRKPIVRKTGAWHLTAADQEPENLDAQVAEIFTRVNSDLAVWAVLSSKYKLQLFCGFFMEVSGEDLEVTPETLKVLADRGIKLYICIYAPTNDVVETKEIIGGQSIDQRLNQYLNLGWVLLEQWLCHDGDPSQPNRTFHALLGWKNKATPPVHPVKKCADD